MSVLDLIMQAASNVEFQPVGHRYFIHGQEVPSCSQIMRRKDPDGFKISQEYLDRGRLVHACLAGEVGVHSMPREWQGFAQAGLRARDELKLVPIAQEFLIGSEEFEYAGRADEFAAILPGSPLHEKGLIHENVKFLLNDWKSSSTGRPPTSTQIQTVLYLLPLVRLGLDPRTVARAATGLSPTGEYKIKNYLWGPEFWRPHFAMALNLLEYHHYATNTRAWPGRFRDKWDGLRHQLMFPSPSTQEYRIDTVS